MYRDLLRQGMSLSEIENSDLYFLLDVIYEIEDKQEKESVTYAEDVPWL